MVDWRVVGFIAVLANSVTATADFETGLSAAQRGDYATALQEWRLLAEQGDPSAQVSLGNMYAAGVGVSQDFAHAASWYRRAAASGDAVAGAALGPAYVSIGEVFARGKRMPRDSTAAAKWFRLGAEQGNADAQNRLGMLYAAGDGVPRDDVTAYAWFSLAAAQGSDEAVANRAAARLRLTPSQLSKGEILARELSRQIHGG